METAGLAVSVAVSQVSALLASTFSSIFSWVGNLGRTMESVCSGQMLQKHAWLAGERLWESGLSYNNRIKDYFEDAEHLSEIFKNRTIELAKQSEDLLTYDPQSDLDPELQRLHLTMRELAIKRQRSTNLLKKTTWALYEKKRFDTLIAEVTGFVDKLVDLFPSIQDSQKTLCRTEVSAVGDTGDLALLKDIASSDDPYLEAAVVKEMESRGHVFTDWKADGKSKMWAGDENAFGET
ncbi:hypothetical protein EPUS_09279 [Endocarpon pusillum Z07020]|uniref:Prion-inhibition and propagation HeLo domain-containing protein n=1 Tax=Endocarpon pusillum (strain Z07020 / HMAS-L-300199) TaxID=1263415 RepID=U1GF08_ENDPU|nr:uncharacterized protein EPUS_09279 [Endocarpon pusillum Z07020]ERF76212.1 hypothetical protein EPUS_09279 [Endocarpon pusillum Z07020]